MAWDRQHRGGLLRAYLATVLTILCAPWRAAEGLAVPDQWGRAARWAACHVAFGAIAAAVLGSYQHYIAWGVEHIRAEPFHPPHVFLWTDTPFDRVAAWFAQSLGAWVVVLALPVALGLLLSGGIPGRHQAAKLSGAKWSLYASVIPVIVPAAWYGCWAIWPPMIQAPFPFKFSYRGGPPPIPAWLVVGVYGLWWAAGMARNPYDRIRSRYRCLLYGSLFACAWVLTAYVLFPAGELESLL